MSFRTLIYEMAIITSDKEQMKSIHQKLFLLEKLEKVKEILEAQDRNKIDYSCTYEGDVQVCYLKIVKHLNVGLHLHADYYFGTTCDPVRRMKRHEASKCKPIKTMQILYYSSHMSNVMQMKRMLIARTLSLQQRSWRDNSNHALNRHLFQGLISARRQKYYVYLLKYC